MFEEGNLMTYELVYRSSKGNNNYWSVNERFTRKETGHFQWSSAIEINQIFPQLKAKYPTLFAKKKTERFYYLDVKSSKLIKLSPDQEEIKAALTPDGIPQDNYTCPLKITDSKYYAIAIDAPDGRYYFNTSKGVFLKTVNDEVRRWREFDKAAATANTIRVNKKIWNKYPDWNPLSNYVINLKTGAIVWPNKELNSFFPASFESNYGTTNSAFLLMMLEQLDTQLQEHFSSINQQPMNTIEDPIEIPQIDFERYNAKETFIALSYIVRVIAQKPLIDKALKCYDKELLQDYLHTIELADLSRFNANEFTNQLQQTRLKRRKIKNLALFLNIIAENMNVEKILKQLWQEPSLRNCYHYRHPETGQRMLDIMNVKSGEGRAGENY